LVAMDALPYMHWVNRALGVRAYARFHAPYQYFSTQQY
jgi:hypothetical protein